PRCGGVAQPLYKVLAAVLRHAGRDGERLAGLRGAHAAKEGEAMILRESARIISLEKKLREARLELQEALADTVRGEVRDYPFENQAGPVKLSQLFADKRDLFMVHNMGTTCPQCTMWADGFNGFYPHLASRAAVVVVSPDPPEQQAE